MRKNKEKLKVHNVLNLPEVDKVINPFAFEKYCGSCDFFNTEECLFNAKVDENTEWKKIKCTKYWN